MLRNKRIRALERHRKICLPWRSSKNSFRSISVYRIRSAVAQGRVSCNPKCASALRALSMP